MASAIPTSEPSSVFQGDTLKFSKTLADYSAADGWSLRYYFVSDDATGNAFDFTAATDGGGFLIKQDTSGFLPANYNFRAVVSKIGETYTVETGILVVKPSLTSGGDVRSQAKRTLDNIEAVIEGRASSSILNSTVEGTALQRIPISDLLMLRDRYKQIVLSEQRQANGVTTRRRILGKFVPA